MADERGARLSAFRTVAVVPAAGAAERFGGDKLLADIDGETMIDRTVAALLDGGVDEVIVVFGPDGSSVQRDVSSLLDPRVRPDRNPDPSRGMLSSIQEGLRTAHGEALLVLPGDMPYVRAATVSALLETFGRSPAIVSPRHRGKRGHPIVIPYALRDEVLAADPRSNLHEVLKPHAERRVDVDVDDPGVVRDVDEPSDIAAPSA